jgi:hypothetical protein
VLNEKFDLPNTFAASFNPLCVGNPGPVKLSGTRKVIQLTGDMDRETRHITPNQTGKNFGIYGTDLGVSFLHDGKLYFLFGDTLLGLPVVAWRIPVFEELYSQNCHSSKMRLIKFEDYKLFAEESIGLTHKTNPLEIRGNGESKNNSLYFPNWNCVGQNVLSTIDSIK